jgi:hypothetical protein
MVVALRRALQHWRILDPLAPAAQNLGVGLRRPYRGQVCGGVLGAMARIAPPQPNEAMARIASSLLSAAAQWQTKEFSGTIRFF